MLGLICGPEKVAVEPGQMRYDAFEGMWIYDSVGTEFQVAGDAGGPHSIRFEVAQRVAAHMRAFTEYASDYLSAFVVPERFAANGPWTEYWVEFGRRAEDSVDDFDLFLELDGDTYGLWIVQFKYYSPPIDRHFPHQFSRRNW